jgi:hypothetical protein
MLEFSVSIVLQTNDALNVRGTTPSGQYKMFWPIIIFQNVLYYGTKELVPKKLYYILFMCLSTLTKHTKLMGLFIYLFLFAIQVVFLCIFPRTNSPTLSPSEMYATKIYTLLSASCILPGEMPCRCHITKYIK